VAAELMLLPRERVPTRYADLERYVESVITSDRLLRTDVSDNVADLIRKGPVPATLRPIWAFIRFAAFGTLHPSLQMLYRGEVVKRERPLAPSQSVVARKSATFLAEEVSLHWTRSLGLRTAGRQTQPHSG